MNFIYKKGEENIGISLTLLHSTSAPNLKNIKIKDIQEIHVKNDDVKNGDLEVFDFPTSLFGIFYF